MKPDTAILVPLLLAFAMPSSAIAADKVTTVPVTFAKGASTATLKGSLAGYDSVRYTLSARAGQTMAVTTSGSTNANFNVFKPGDVPGQSTALGVSDGARWSGTLPATGTYTVQVYQMRASARRGEKVNYAITFAIR
jgi:hypothetical protein